MSKPNAKDEERWAAYRDAESFRGIVHRYGAMVHGTCSRVLRNATDAEEVTQECFESLAVSNTPPDGYSLGAWLHGMATKRSLMRLRAERRRATRESIYASRLPQTVDVGWNDIYQYVDEAVAALPEELRVPVIYHFYEGLSDRKIAKALDVSRRTIRDRLARGVAAVAESLRRRGLSVGLPALAAMLHAKLAEALPLNPSLASALGHLALAHAGCCTVPKAASASRIVAFWTSAPGKWTSGFLGFSALIALAALDGRSAKELAESRRVPHAIYTTASELSEAMAAPLSSGGLAVALPDLLEMRPPVFEEKGKFGMAVTVIDDVTGDNIPDLVVGASDQRGSQEMGSPGRVHFLDGVSGECFASLDSPNPEPPCVPWACDAHGGFGGNVLTVQDMDGNGYPEVAIAAYGERVGENYAAGRVYIFDSLTRELIRTLETPNLQNFANLGTSIDGVPDVNHDGVDDVIVGAGQESPAGLNAAGRAYIFSGATGEVLHTLVSPDGAGAHIFGLSVAGLSDVDGDCAGDVVVGQSIDGLERVHVFSGATGKPIAMLRSPNEPDGGAFGQSLMRVPDCNGNGSCDFLVAASQETSRGIEGAGRVYAVDGRTCSVVRVFESPSNDTRSMGVSMAYSNDITGDAQPDYLIGARSKEVSDDSVPHILIFGANDGRYKATVAPPNPKEGDDFFRIACVSDINGDAIDELLVTAPFASSGGKPDVGRAYVMKSPLLDSAGSPPSRTTLAAHATSADTGAGDAPQLNPRNGVLTQSGDAVPLETHVIRVARRLLRHIAAWRPGAENSRVSVAHAVDSAEDAEDETLDAPWGCRPQTLTNRVHP